METDQFYGNLSLFEIIQERRQRCDESIQNSTSIPLQGTHCPVTFDGWSCWPTTLASTSAYVPCPFWIEGFDPKIFVAGSAHKDCDENGTWFRHPSSNKPWSNYTTCVDTEDLNVRLQVIGIYETGYLVSLVALLISLATLSYFKALRCPRNTMHKNLFTSFAVNNFLWLLWYRLIVTEPEVINENGVGCQVLHVVLHYFLLTNYFWMLAEGFYLHTLLVSAFISEERLVRWLYVLGWVTPIPIIFLYTVLRLYYQATDQCWLVEGFMMVLIIPVSLSMALNLVFLCNIVRVLLIKLRAGPTHLTEGRPSRTLLQAFRATLLLLPLLGLHYLLTPFRPPKGHPLEVIYDIMSSATASFQGLCVATLFCFCNGEVIAQVKRRWQFVVFRPRMNSYTATTVSVRQFVRSTVVPLTCEDNV
ncbi:calcitonin gene-related peptide type 1 receptor isoform X1 [Bemisia tabaci]|uniref:calcitonin gene-related peptide type 1 receptor isoform X1 n=1 Tax=Bemisia tabaci TaxID=7038 RepID=UPI003B27C695